MRPHRKETAGAAKIRQRLSLARGKDPGLYDARRHPDSPRDEGAGRCDHGGVVIDFGLLRHQPRLALHHQYVGEHRQSESAPQLSHSSELLVERSRLYQGAEEFRCDDIRLSTYPFEKYRADLLQKE